MKIISPRKVEIEVKRPNGEVETSIHPKIDWMNDKIFEHFNAAMKVAGRGVGLTYRNIEAVVEMEDSDYQGHCESCNEKIDTRKAYGQMEWTRFGGQKVQVKTHYCDRCRRLLQQVGIGEETAMKQRASEIPSYEPTHKPEADA